MIAKWFWMPVIYRIGTTKMGLPDEHFQYNRSREIAVLMRYGDTVVFKDFVKGLEYHQSCNDENEARELITSIRTDLEADGFRQTRRGEH